MLKTNHVQLVRGSSLPITRIARDDKNRPIDLTGATIYLAVRADVKVAPTFKLISGSPPEGWREGIVIDDQSTYPGQYTYTFEPEDTEGLVALGHDDPWLYDVKIKLADETVIVDVAMSNFDLYPQMTDLPEA